MINSVCGIGSTGRICTDLAAELEAQGHEVKIAYGRGTVPDRYQKYAVRIGNTFGIKLHALKTRLFDATGFGSKGATKSFLRWVREYDPDVIYLHNLHGYYINVELLFDYLKTCGKKVIWTLHDCWSFTGHCPHFTMVKCEQWKSHCLRCGQTRTYPKCILRGNAYRNFERKRAAFTGVPNMTLITPSKWLADLVKQSYLKAYPVEVVYNKIDTEVFKPTPSDFREQYGLTDKKIVLGVSSVWNERKGLNDFLKLSSMLDERYVIVLVGLKPKQMKKLPKNILGIARTNSPRELAEIYTAADVFLNLTYEDTYPTTNLEAQACGTPCITYRTGGSVESVPEENIVEQGDLYGVIQKINRCIEL